MKAFYNPRTDTIEGCKPFSVAWYHEARHRWQYERGWAQRTDNLFVWSEYVSFIAGIGGWLWLGPPGLFVGIGVAMFPALGALALLELDAYVTGFAWYVKSKSLNNQIRIRGIDGR